VRVAFGHGEPVGVGRVRVPVGREPVGVGRAPVAVAGGNVQPVGTD
jgi:hypothetical protein